MRHKPCLVLNQDYRPLKIISWKRALCKQIIGKEIPGEGISVVEYYEDELVTSAGGESFPLPAVAVTNRYIKKKKKVALRKRNLLVRDNRTCQYCGKKLDHKDATIDHIIPKSHFRNPKDAHTWRNTVIACWKCNSKKAARTPEQANMALLNEPIEPITAKYYGGISAYRQVPKEWEPYVKF